MSPFDIKIHSFEKIFFLVNNCFLICAFFNVCLSETCDSEKIEVLVCWLYTSTLIQLPALVRQWWTGLDARISQIVERVTSLYVSSNLINQELVDVMKYQSQFKNMVVSKNAFQSSKIGNIIKIEFCLKTFSKINWDEYEF